MGSAVDRGGADGPNCGRCLPVVLGGSNPEEFVGAVGGDSRALPGIDSSPEKGSENKNPPEPIG
jgi:hypothetical protein